MAANSDFFRDVLTGYKHRLWDGWYRQLGGTLTQGAWSIGVLVLLTLCFLKDLLNIYGARENTFMRNHNSQV